MKKSVCCRGHVCGAFNMCAMEMMETCGGPIPLTKTSIQIFNTLLPHESEFKMGHCQHCGDETLIASVNYFIKACRPCWINTVLQFRAISR